MNRNYYGHTAVLPILITGADDVASSEMLWTFCEHEHEQENLQTK
jgi:hypothetical protein